jgi:hypothetical protein
MGGGLIQIAIKGQMDAYTTINPDISFYKFGYKKYTNYAMESISLNFDINPVINNNVNNNYNCKINRHGDLLNNLYFCYTLPAVYSSDKYRFKWIKNIGSLLIKKISILIGNSVIDTLTGEWMNIWNELVLSKNDKDNFNIITQNVESVINPSIKDPIIGIRNNKFYKLFYPSSTFNSSNPSIESKKVIVPLNFWFCRNTALALPLLQLQLSDITLNIQLENSENLYQIWSEDLQLYVSPSYYNDLYSTNINIFNFIKSSFINPYIEANYIFIDTNERNSFLSNPLTDILVEQLEINNTIPAINSLSSISTTINLNTHKLVKEIIWTLKRDDYYYYNENTNYTSSIPENNECNILNKALINWNNNLIRVDEKESDFFHKIQPYQYHTSIPKTGIYCYSFAIYPEKWFPTGTYNASSINTNLVININNIYNNDTINNKLIKMNKKPYNFSYIINIYVKTYNIFSINGGTGAMKYV